MDAQWFIVIGTFILASIAFFQDPIRSWFKTPKLEISTDNVFPFCMKLLFRDKNEPRIKANGYAIRISVKNVRYNYRVKCMAELVEMYASKLYRKGTDGNFHTVQNFEPTDLIWSHSFGYLDNISPNMERYCFIGRMLKPGERNQFPEFDDESLPREETCLRIDTAVSRHTKTHILSPGTYRIDCLIGGSNTKAVKKTFDIYFSGEWFDDEEKMFGKGLNIKLIE